MKHHRGFTLLEVLVSLIILSIGVLGMGRMLMMSTKSNSSSYARSAAMTAANAMLDRMRANRAEALRGAAGGYQLAALTTAAGYGAAPDCVASICTATAVARYDVLNWLQGLASAYGLPNGAGSIVLATVGSQTSVVVTVQWDDSIAQQALRETVNPATFRLTTTL